MPRIDLKDQLEALRRIEARVNQAPFDECVEIIPTEEQLTELREIATNLLMVCLTNRSHQIADEIRVEAESTGTGTGPQKPLKISHGSLAQIEDMDRRRPLGPC